VASKDSILVGHVFVTAFCRRGAKPVADIARGSSTTREHVIEMQNGSTLPYDVTVLTQLPDSPPINPGGNPTLQFTHGTMPRAVDWTARAVQLGSGDTRPDVATIHCVATALGKVRLTSPVIEYRTGPGVAWETDPTTKSTLSIELNITR
jgi:hypothetical protein